MIDTRTAICKHCDEEIEPGGWTIGWVEVAEGGSFDICNDSPTGRHCPAPTEHSEALAHAETESDRATFYNLDH